MLANRLNVNFALFLIFFVGFLLGSSLFAQEFSNQTDEQGRKQGWWKKVDEAQQPIYQGRFINDIPVDTFIYFYPNGKRKAEVIFSDSGRITRTSSFFVNGFPMAKGKYIERKRDSLWQFFSEIDGALISEEWYVDGLKNGVETIYYAGQGTSEIITWNEGEKEGPWIQYYMDGKTKLRAQFLHGERDGLFKTFFENGCICVTGDYMNGQKDGNWIYYDKEGNVTLKEWYKEGVLVKEEKF